VDYAADLKASKLAHLGHTGYELVGAFTVAPSTVTFEIFRAILHAKD
jgi:hypothetical protein